MRPSISVLIVEDDQAIAELYAMKLRLDGYTVHHAFDGTTADIIFERLKPNLVCVDTRLPDGSGVDVAARFTCLGATVILLTNDQESYENPPAGVIRSLLKSRTNPGQLSDAIGQIFPSRRNQANS